MFRAEWNTGWLFAMIILCAIAGIGALLFVICGIYWAVKGRKSSGYGTSVSGATAVAGAAVLVIFAGIATWVGFPFAGAYHRYVPVTGTVQVTNSRFLSDGNGGTNQNYLVGINGQDYRCDDTRCSQLVKGDVVTLMCEKSWETNGTSGYVCNWGKLDSAKG